MSSPRSPSSSLASVRDSLLQHLWRHSSREGPYVRWPYEDNGDDEEEEEEEAYPPYHHRRPPSTFEQSSAPNYDENNNPPDEVALPQSQPNTNIKATSTIRRSNNHRRNIHPPNNDSILEQAYRDGDPSVLSAVFWPDWEAFAQTWARQIGGGTSTTSNSPVATATAAARLVLLPSLEDDSSSHRLSLLHYLCLAKVPPDIFRSVWSVLTAAGTLSSTTDDGTTTTTTTTTTTVQHLWYHHMVHGGGAVGSGGTPRWWCMEKATPLHLACFAGCHPIVVQTLVRHAVASSDSALNPTPPHAQHQPQCDDNALCRTDAWGRIPLHLVIGSSQRAELVPLVATPRALATPNAGGHTALSLAAAMPSVKVVAAVWQAYHTHLGSANGDHRPTTTGTEDDNAGPTVAADRLVAPAHACLPLHRAIRAHAAGRSIAPAEEGPYAPHYNRRRRCRPTSRRRHQHGHIAVLQWLTRAQPDLVRCTDPRRQTALHVALAVGMDSVPALRGLLHGAMALGGGKGGGHDRHHHHHDPSSVSLLAAKDVLGRTPVDILFHHITQQPEEYLSLVKALVQADEKRILWSTLGENKESLLDRYVRYLLNEATNDKKDTASSEASTEILYQLLLGTPPGTGSYGTSMSVSQTIIGNTLYEEFLGDPEWYHTMNQVMSQRVFTFYFMTDLYVRILLVIMFSVGTHDRLNDDNQYTTWWAFLIAYCCAAYLLLWQLKLILRYELYYMRDIWSLLDVTTLVLVVISASFLQSSASIASYRSFHVLAGGMVWFITLTVALRSTFLPFAVFVSGLIKILFYMIPFGTTTFLILGAFAEMYYKSMIQRPECNLSVVEADFCEFGESFLAVYNMFLSGIDPSLLSTETANHLLWLTISFQVTFAIVMLNVLVAVIFDAWGSVSPQGRIVFGLHRHRFLMEVTEKGWFCFAQPSFGPSSKCLGSLERHIAAVLRRFHERPATAHQSTFISVKLSESFMYLAEGAYLAIWFILGLFSAGVLWAKPFRTAIFTFRQEANAPTRRDNNDKETGRTASADDLLDDSQRYINQLEQELVRVRTERRR